ncbi:PAS domain S-box protein [Halopiger xanaduensis]|uniref:histidine kinase n=1 Tax=Halopiger xanaduensis (strain DSM 18323 / JCM 14033 / SH-6) TaxID=797210 RepID=F8D857_HALXS|nr:PAS domain S-box protein [Halopiger xanaduensis]AEH37953.1 PAS/PAC sensor signal transduction histidine kinase [Halopiger xanaduensis SH-6]
MHTQSDATDSGFWGGADDDDVALQRFRTLVETIDDGLYQLDAAGRFVAVNDAVVETTGYSRDELLGEHISLLLDDTDVEAIERELAAALAGGDEGEAAVALPTFELAIRTVDGDEIPCELRVSPLIADGELQGTIGVARDLAETKERLQTLESVRAPDGPNAGVVVLDDALDVTWVDDTAAAFLDLDRDAVVGRDGRTVVEDTIADRLAAPEPFVRSVTSTYDEGSYLDRYECRATGDDGQSRWLEYQSKPIESGEYAGGRIELYSDITDRKRSESDLRESREAFESLVDAVEEYAIFRLDADGTVISWNQGAKQIKGYDADEIVGEHFSTFYTQEDRADGIPDQNLEIALENGSVEDEGWRVRQDGSRFWANVTITPVRDADGTHRGFLKVTRDMTDRWEREQELESELQQILGRVSDAFYAVDDEFRFTHVNDRAAELLERSEDELLGERLWDVFPDLRDFDEVWDAFHTAMETQSPTSYELYYDTLDFWVEANLYPSATGISVYFRDVTERVQRERELEESEQRYRTLAEHFPNGIVTLFDHDLEYTLAAGQGFDKIPVDPDDLEGENFYDVWSEETAADLEPALLAALEGEQESVELKYVGREWVLYAVPITDSRGDVFAGVTMAHDITERKKSQRQLEETIAQLEESNERLEQFAYAASHDLQEPLRMVSSYLQLIESRYADTLDEDGEEFLEFAVDGAERMRDMIDGLLEYSRVETQGAPLEPIALDPVLEDVLEDLQLQIEETDAEIAIESLPRVEGDASQLRQVFQNLLSNALEYSGDEPPRVRVDAERRGDRWLISVADEGIGIDADEQEAVFNVFKRLHSRDEHPGTGIGLALCQRIVERHGGDIWVDSEPGEGATFSFTLPAVDDRE